jgi:hypothetical protein
MAAGPKNRIMSSFSLVFIIYNLQNGRYLSVHRSIQCCVEFLSIWRTPWKSSFSEAVSPVRKHFFSFCIIRMSTNVFEKALYWLLSWWIFLHPHISLRSILILSSNLWICLQLAPFHLCFSTKMLLKSQLSHACYMLLPSLSQLIYESCRDAFFQPAVTSSLSDLYILLSFIFSICVFPLKWKSKFHTPIKQSVINSAI